MGKKNKKEKKKKEKAVPENQLSAVDQAFFELTIKDLSNKLSYLRTHNQMFEDSNEELRNQMHHTQVDRTDVMGVTDKQLAMKKSDIKDLEEKLYQLGNEREAETKAFQSEINELSIKFIDKENELSMEINSINGKLNSLEEFRIQKEVIASNLTQFEDELKQSEEHHKEVLFEMERQDVIRKDGLKKDVEQRLLQLSNKFAKSNEIRIASHIRRSVRENIALNNELDRMQFTQLRMQKEMVDMKDETIDQMKFSVINEKENKQLIRNSDKQLLIINQLTNECEHLVRANYELVEAKRAAMVETDREERLIEEQFVLEEKVAKLEQEVHSRESYCIEHIANIKQHNAEVQRLLDILNKIKMTIQLCMESDELLQQDICGHRSFREHTRSHLLNDLMSILHTVDDGPVLKQSMETIPSIRELYATQDFGLIAKQSYKLTAVKPSMSILELFVLKHEQDQLQSGLEVLEKVEPKSRANEGLLVVDLHSICQSQSTSSENTDVVADDDGKDADSSKGAFSSD